MHASTLCPTKPGAVLRHGLIRLITGWRSLDPLLHKGLGRRLSYTTIKGGGVFLNNYGASILYKIYQRFARASTETPTRGHTF